MGYLDNIDGSTFRDVLPNPGDVPVQRGSNSTDPTAVTEIEQAIIDGYKDDIALKYYQFILEKMYGADVRASIARFDLWLDVRINSVEAKGEQIDLDYKKIQEELADFKTQFEILISAQTIDGEVKLARHSVISGKTFASLKARLDWMEEEHYLLDNGSVVNNRTLIDDDFSKNHTLIKISEVSNPTEDNPIVIATVDDDTQGRFRFAKVGEV